MRLPLVHSLRLPLCAALTLLAVGGCALKPSGPAEGFYMVTSLTAEFYKYGPAQSFGPDLVLKKGERLTMLEKQWGFSRVMMTNGVAGYVASEDIDPVMPIGTPVRVAANSRRTTGPTGKPGGMSTTRQNRIRSEVLSDPGDPLFNVNDVPLPMLEDLPPSGARPQFRATQPAPQEPGQKPKPKFR